MRWKRLGIALLLGVLLLIASGVTAARDVLQGDVCTLEADQTVVGNLYVLCRTLILDGTVTGDVIGIAVNAQINGSVENDVYLLAGQLDVRGRMGEDVIFAGPVLYIHDDAVFTDDRGGILSASVSTRLTERASIPGSVVSASYQLVLDGDVGGEVAFWGSALTINGAVGGDIDATVGDAENGDSGQVETLLIPFRFLDFNVSLIDPGLIVSETARIDGKLRYSAPVSAQIQGELAEPPLYTPIITRPDFTQIDLSDETSAAGLITYLTEVAQEIVTLGLVGLLGLVMAPRLLQAPLNHLRQRPLSSLGVGILTFIISFAVWIVSLLLLLLIIFIFLALQLSDLFIIALMGLGVVNIGGTSIFYFVAIYISRVVVCLAVGRVAVRLVLGDDGSPRILYISLLVGVTLLGLVAWLPVIGSILSGLALALGLGAIALTVTRAQFREPPRASVTPATPISVLPGRSETTRQIPPPPIIDDRPASPGMNNLPEGFQWWGDEDK